MFLNCTYFSGLHPKSRSESIFRGKSSRKIFLFPLTSIKCYTLSVIIVEDFFLQKIIYSAEQGELFILLFLGAFAKGCVLLAFMILAANVAIAVPFAFRARTGAGCLFGCVFHKIILISIYIYIYMSSLLIAFNAHSRNHTIYRIWHTPNPVC